MISAKIGVTYGVPEFLGARTNRETAGMDVAISLTGRTPYHGLHLEEKRWGELLIEVQIPKPTREHLATFRLFHGAPSRNQNSGFDGHGKRGPPGKLYRHGGSLRCIWRSCPLSYCGSHSRSPKLKGGFWPKPDSSTHSIWGATTGRCEKENVYSKTWYFRCGYG